MTKTQVSGWIVDGKDDGCRIFRLIVIKHKGVFLLQNRENWNQFSGNINLNKNSYGLESRSSNKNICKYIELIISLGTCITKENVHNKEMVVGQFFCRLGDKTFIFDWMRFGLEGSYIKGRISCIHIYRSVVIRCMGNPPYSMCSAA